MLRYSKSAGILAAAVIALMWAAPAQAQASRTWVSGVGDDVNPCSRTAPCKTWPGAISKTAAGGEIDSLDPGGFGAVTITKAMTLDGGGGIGGQVSSILVSSGNAINVNAGANDRIKIRNMTLNGLVQLVGAAPGSGIKFNTGAALIVEHVAIFGFGASGGSGIDFEPSTAGAKLFTQDVEIQNNNGTGIFVAPSSSASAVIDNTSMLNNNIGVRCQEGAIVDVYRSNISGNTTTGASAAVGSTGCSINLDSVIVARNGTGVSTSGANAFIHLSNVSVYDNSTGIAAPTGHVVSYQNNHSAGNGVPGAPTDTAGPF